MIATFSEHTNTGVKVITHHRTNSCTDIAFHSHSPVPIHVGVLVRGLIHQHRLNVILSTEGIRRQMAPKILLLLCYSTTDYGSSITVGG